jgi:Glycosyltransferase family 10 (fucosyltransferase) C-term
MKNIGVIKNWDYKLDLLRQTPAGQGIWEDCQFTLNPTDRCDYLIVLNRSRQDVVITVPPEQVWAIIQEPPNEVFKPFHRGQRAFSRVYGQDISLRSPRHIHAAPALPWFIHKTYDDLIRCNIPEKTKTVSSIMSRNAWFSGHRKRLIFLEQLQHHLDLDLFGWGFHFIEDKWDALAPYRYSIVVENHQGLFYWSEKLTDCLLSFTMPIYYGCTNIYDFFPKEAIVSIDIASPTVFEEIQAIVHSDLYWQNLDAIIEARNLILNQYQFFPFVHHEIQAFEAANPTARAAEKLKISAVRGLQKNSTPVIVEAGG